jgi:hypothetical protein
MNCDVETEYINLSHFLKNYIIKFTEKDIPITGFTGNVYSIYRNLFTKPVELVFFWQKQQSEDNIHIFAIYKYKKTYIVLNRVENLNWKGILDFNQLNQKINNIFNDLHFYNNTLDILLSTNNYELQKLIGHFILFQNNFHTFTQSSHSLQF